MYKIEWCFSTKFHKDSELCMYENFELGQPAAEKGGDALMGTLGTQPPILGAFSGCCLTLRLPSTVHHNEDSACLLWPYQGPAHSRKSSASEPHLHSHCLQMFSWRQGFFDLPRLASNGESSCLYFSSCCNSRCASSILVPNVLLFDKVRARRLGTGQLWE